MWIEMFYCVINQLFQKYHVSFTRSAESRVWVLRVTHFQGTYPGKQKHIRIETLPSLIPLLLRCYVARRLSPPAITWAPFGTYASVSSTLHKGTEISGPWFHQVRIWQWKVIPSAQIEAQRKNYNSLIYQQAKRFQSTLKRLVNLTRGLYGDMYMSCHLSLLWSSPSFWALFLPSSSSLPRFWVCPLAT